MRTHLEAFKVVTVLKISDRHLGSKYTLLRYGD